MMHLRLGENGTGNYYGTSWLQKTAWRPPNLYPLGEGGRRRTCGTTPLPTLFINIGLYIGAEERIGYIKQLVCVACPPNFTKTTNDSCYSVISERLNWTDAGRRCRSLHKDAHLVIINDAQEQSAIAQMIDSINSQCYRIVFCIYDLTTIYGTEPNVRPRRTPPDDQKWHSRFRISVVPTAMRCCFSWSPNWLYSAALTAAAITASPMRRNFVHKVNNLKSSCHFLKNFLASATTRGGRDTLRSAADGTGQPEMNYGRSRVPTATRCCTC